MRHIRTNQPIKRSLTVRSIGPAALLGAALLLLAGCGNMVGGLETEQATGSITPRITSSAVSASKIDSYTVTVSGPDIETYTQTFSGGSSRLEIAVTPGERTFTVSGAISDPHSFVTEITGDSSVQVSANETTNASVSLNTVTDSRILFADGGNNRIVMFDDMQGNGWKELYPTAGEDGLEFGVPFDTDFDSRGRLYVATDQGVFRTDDIAGANLVQLYDTGGDDDIRSISIDRVNQRVYFLVGNNELREAGIAPDGSWTGDTLISNGLSSTAAVEALPDGRVVLGQDGALNVYDAVAEGFVNTFDTTTGETQGLHYSNGDFYALVDDYSSFLTVSDPVVYKLDPSAGFAVEGTYGTIDDLDGLSGNVGEFLAAVQFGSTVQNGLFIADFGTLNRRVIFIEGITGDGWTTFGTIDGEDSGDNEEESDSESDADRGEFLFSLPFSTAA